jgi:hypothetical protein
MAVAVGTIQKLKKTFGLSPTCLSRIDSGRFLRLVG